MEKHPGDVNFNWYFSLVSFHFHTTEGFESPSAGHVCVLPAINLFYFCGEVLL